MKILYRPCDGGIAEALEKMKRFNTVEEMLDYIVAQHKLEDTPCFDKKDIRICYYGYDSRIDWETYLITVDRYYKENYLEKYHCPQAIGYMTFKYDTGEKTMIKEKEFFEEYKVVELNRNGIYEYYLEKDHYAHLFFIYAVDEPIKISEDSGFWGE